MTTQDVLDPKSWAERTFGSCAGYVAQLFREKVI